MGNENSRLVYSTDPGLNQRCPRCRELLVNCTCPAEEAVPANLTVKLRLEKGGRGGKAVTVLYDLPRNPAFLKELATKLKKALGTGGTAKEDSVEIQGDYRDRLRELLPKLGYKVKG
jgi:translation initiation factor 1